jgi:hypothetical protein
MDAEGRPEYDATLTVVMRLMTSIIEQQAEAVGTQTLLAAHWERRAILSTATLANDLGLRVREAEARERRLRTQLLDLLGRSDARPDELRLGLARVLNDGVYD